MKIKNIEKKGIRTLYFFGGPYSNLQATNELRRILDKKGVSPTDIFCTGDTLAYCASPNETLGLLRDWGITSIQGNVEQQILNEETNCGCNFDKGSECDLLSKNWYDYIQRNLTSESKSYLKSFSEQLSIKTDSGKIRVIHGGVEDISKFLFNKTENKSFKEQLSLLNDDTSIIVAGHSGIPFGKSFGHQHWLNAGVIGMPANDGSRSGHYIELELGLDITVNFKSFDYDSKEASRLMEENNLPKSYSSSILSGLWANQDIIPKEQRDDQGNLIYDKVMFIKS